MFLINISCCLTFATLSGNLGSTQLCVRDWPGHLGCVRWHHGLQAVHSRAGQTRSNRWRLANCTRTISCSLLQPRARAQWLCKVFKMAINVFVFCSSNWHLLECGYLLSAVWSNRGAHPAAHHAILRILQGQEDG